MVTVCDPALKIECCALTLIAQSEIRRHTWVCLIEPNHIFPVIIRTCSSCFIWAKLRSNVTGSLYLRWVKFDLTGPIRFNWNELNQPISSATVIKLVAGPQLDVELALERRWQNAHCCRQRTMCQIWCENAVWHTGISCRFARSVYKQTRWDYLLDWATSSCEWKSVEICMQVIRTN